MKLELINCDIMSLKCSEDVSGNYNPIWSKYMPSRNLFLNKNS